MVDRFAFVSAPLHVDYARVVDLDIGASKSITVVTISECGGGEPHGFGKLSAQLRQKLSTGLKRM
jgi:hypothetical protein